MSLKIVLKVVFVMLISSLFIYATTNFVNKKEKPIVTFQFAEEEVPTKIVDVQERLDRELLINANYHSNTSLVIKRANKVFPVIEPILKKYGVPDDFKYLAVIESSLVNATSPAGAKGVWQFMPATAKEYGLEVTNKVDERYHLEKSTEAACKYLLDAKNIFGNWTLVAASYNAGMNGIKKAMEVQNVDNYYDMLLNEETSRYVFRILAIKEVMQNPTRYDFRFAKEDLYQTYPTKKISVATSITDFSVFAKEQGINYKLLKYYNPWLRDTSLTIAEGKNYTIEIPTSGY